VIGCVHLVIFSRSVPALPADQGPPPYEVLAGLVVSLRGELAESQAASPQVTAELATATMKSSMRQVRPPGS
jgi:hypothetical protein